MYERAEARGAEEARKAEAFRAAEARSAKETRRGGDPPPSIVAPGRGRMLIRVTGPEFAAGLVLGQDHRVARAAPILHWALGMSADELRAELKRRGLQGAYVKILTGPEIDKGSDEAMGETS